MKTQTLEQIEENSYANLRKSGQLDKVAKLLAKALLYYEVVATRDELDALPTGSIICCEIEEYRGIYTLTNFDDCCSGWHDFETFINEDNGCAITEIKDDWTPELPALVVQMGSPNDLDEEE